MKLYPPSLLGALLALAATVGLGQPSPAVAVFTDYSPTIKGMAIGPAQCFFWSQLPPPGYPLEIACRVNGTYHQIQIGDHAAITFGGFGYCEDGTILASVSSTIAIPNCKPGVAGGNFTWIITPSTTGPGFNFYIAAWPTGAPTSTMRTGTF